MARAPKGYEVIARALAAHGVAAAFGLVGDANLHIVHALTTRHGVRYVSATHEAAAVSMADGYARVTGRVGLALVTHGPGLTNTVTALTEAARARTPLVLIAGDTPPEPRQHLQDIVQRDVVQPTGAHFMPIRSAATLAEDVALAFRRARLDRVPVVLNVPLDVQRAASSYEPVVVDVTEQPTAPSAAALDRAVGIIASAKRPVVIAGRGALQAAAEVTALAARIEAPVATTLLAKGLFAGSPCDLDVVGTLSTPLAHEIITSADVLVVVGAALNRYTAADGAFVDGKAIVQIDRDPAAFGRWVPVDAAVQGDAATTLAQVVAWLDEAEVPGSGFTATPLVGRLADYDVLADLVDRGTATTIDPRIAAVHLDRALPPNRVLVTDAGRYLYQMLPYLRLPSAGRLAAGVAFGSIGLGMGLAVGAGVGRSDDTVVGLVGDGGFMMGGIAELSSAVRHGVDLVLVVANDGSYGAEHVQLRREGLDPALSLFDWPDFATVARAVGAEGVTVRNVGDLDEAIAAIAARDRPLLIDLRVDPEVISRDS